MDDSHFPRFTPKLKVYALCIFFQGPFRWKLLKWPTFSERHADAANVVAEGIGTMAVYKTIAQILSDCNSFVWNYYEYYGRLILH